MTRDTFSHYRVLSRLGAGGMGEVYLAEDTSLNRRVAIKVLAPDAIGDEQAQKRLVKEARAAAALDHPNICAIYEVGTADGQSFIAMQYVEGETLSARLDRQRLALRETLDLALQLADALAEAHARGIVHRDLKPSNVMITPRGQAKLMDFGLAKAPTRVSADTQTGAQAQSFVTEPGLIMGTAPYMSPEQANGLPADARSDVFSLGCVLYEMLTGRRAFDEATAMATMAAVVGKEPEPIAILAPGVPHAVQRIVTRALRKDPQDRYPSARELLVELKAAGEAAVQRPPATRRGALVGALVAGAVVIAAALAVWTTRRGGEAPPAPVAKATQITYSAGLDIYPAISPDGNSVAYSSDRGGRFEIYARQLVAGGRDVQLTSDGKQNIQPVWSPNGTEIAYYSMERGGIWTVPVLGGLARQLTTFGARPAWSRDGTMIAFQSFPPHGVLEGTAGLSTIWIVPAAGGQPRQVTEAGVPPGGHMTPSWSPDGKRLLFTANSFQGTSLWSVAADGSALQPVIGQQRRIDNAVYSADGKFVFYAGIQRLEQGLWRIRLGRDGEETGTPELVAKAESVAFTHASLSADGRHLAYTVVKSRSNLVSTPIAAAGVPTGPPVAITNDTSPRNNLPAFSPDGSHLAFVSWRNTADGDIWLADPDGRNATQLTANPAMESIPSWLPGGDRLAFLTDRTGHREVWSISANGGPETRFRDIDPGLEYAKLSPDGTRIAYHLPKGGMMNVWVAPVGAGHPRQLTFDRELMGFPCWSPDGRWLAFQMQRGADTHIVVMPSEGGPVTPLTSAPGQSWAHSWAPDGDRIAFAGLRNGYWNVYWVSKTTKRVQQVTSYHALNIFVRYPAWSPRNDRIVYELSEASGNVWVMDLAPSSSPPATSR